LCRDIEVLSGFWLFCLVKIGHSVVSYYSPNENEVHTAKSFPWCIHTFCQDKVI
jgi:hypothetical protein